MRTLTLLLLMASSCFAQLEVTVEKSQVITGLKNPRLVSGVVIVETGSAIATGEAGFIRVKSDIPSKDIIVEAQKSLFDFAEVKRTGDYEWMILGAGKYLVTVDAWSAETGRLRERKDLELGSPIKPDDPDKPDDPGSPPPGSFQDILQASKAGAATLQDPPTSADLSKSIAAKASQIPASTPPGDAQVAMVVEIENALFRRQGGSRYKDWITLWRKPVNSALDKAKTDGRIKTTADYLAAMKAVAEGLK